jgi:hypothetical protein
MFGRKKKDEVVTENQFANCPQGTQDIVRMRDIIVPNEYRKSKPVPYKQDKCQKLYHKFGHLDKPLTVIAQTNENNRPNKFILIDGYTRYQLAELYKLKRVPVKYITIERYDDFHDEHEKSYKTHMEKKVLEENKTA